MADTTLQPPRFNKTPDEDQYPYQQHNSYIDPLNYNEVQRHKIATVTHLLFKVSSIVLYMISGIIFKSFVFPFVIILILLSFDFWVVKNITGRYLVGLRWWNRTDENDNETWVFEFKDTHLISTADSNMFWMSSYIVLFIWGLMALISLIRLNFGWTIICFVAIGMSIINLTAYTKCDKYAKSQLQKGTRDSLTGSGIFNKLMPSGFVKTIARSWF